MLMTSATVLLSLATASARPVHGGARGAGKATCAKQEFYVSNIEYGNVLPQFHWTCKTYGAEFNPSGYCAVADDPPYVEEHPMKPPCSVEVDPKCPDHAPPIHRKPSAAEGVW